MDHNLVLYGPGISELALPGLVRRFVARLMKHNLIPYGSDVSERGGMWRVKCRA